MSHRSKSDRRRFLKTVGLAGISSALVAPALSGATAPAPPASAAPPAPGALPPAPADTALAAAPAEVGEEARVLAGLIERRYGQHLSKEQLESIARDFDGDLKTLKRMREVRLGNGDEPDFTFRAQERRP
jgi:hypothetical protein